MEIYEGAFVWLFYLAVEPYVRRLWPKTLIAWSRVLEGRLRDPLVGQHILLGALAGLAATLLIHLELHVTGPPARAVVARPPWPGGLQRRPGGEHRVLREALRVPIYILMAVLVLRVVLRRTWVAYLVFLGLPAILFASGVALPNVIVGRDAVGAVARRAHAPGSSGDARRGPVHGLAEHPAHDGLVIPIPSVVRCGKVHEI